MTTPAIETVLCQYCQRAEAVEVGSETHVYRICNTCRGLSSRPPRVYAEGDVATCSHCGSQDFYLRRLVREYRYLNAEGRHLFIGDVYDDYGESEEVICCGCDRVMQRGVDYDSSEWS